jgi:hypothetical protein
VVQRQLQVQQFATTPLLPLALSGHTGNIKWQKKIGENAWKTFQVLQVHLKLEI